MEGSLKEIKKQAEKRLEKYNKEHPAKNRSNKSDEELVLERKRKKLNEYER